MSPAPLFSFDRVGVRTGDGTMLDGVTLVVPDRGITVLVGPSGAGKTTLLRLCNRLDVSTTGTSTFRGTDLDELDPLALRRRVGMIFQRPTVLGGTVRDNLSLAAPDAGDPELVAAMERVELDPGLLGREADLLSVGEAQRMSFARTLLTGPEALLADEPTAALDVGRRSGIERLAQRLASDGMPVMWVTHDLDQARRIADLLVVLIGGTVRAAGAPDVVAHHVGDPEVAAFFSGDLDGR